MVLFRRFRFHHPLSTWHYCILHFPPFFPSFFTFHSSRVHREESVLLHLVAFRILHACSVVFMIMRFPLRVLAIGGVEAGSGKGGRHVSVFFAFVCFSSSSGCSAVISVWRNFKEYLRAQAGRLEKSMRSNVRLWQQALWSMEWNTRYGT
jgi:hypothetical protein